MAGLRQMESRRLGVVSAHHAMGSASGHSDNPSGLRTGLSVSCPASHKSLASLFCKPTHNMPATHIYTYNAHDSLIFLQVALNINVLQCDTDTSIKTTIVESPLKCRLGCPVCRVCPDKVLRGRISPRDSPRSEDLPAPVPSNMGSSARRARLAVDVLRLATSQKHHSSIPYTFTTQTPPPIVIARSCA